MKTSNKLNRVRFVRLPLSCLQSEQPALLPSLIELSVHKYVVWWWWCMAMDGPASQSVFRRSDTLLLCPSRTRPPVRVRPVYVPVGRAGLGGPLHRRRCRRR